MRLIPDYPFSVTLAAAPSGRAAPFHTLRVMRQMVNGERGKINPHVMRTAINLAIQVPARDYLSEVKAIFDYVRGAVRYLRDVHGLETIADPLTTLHRMVGDCDDKATLLAALLEVVGNPTRFVIAQYAGDDYEHVYVEVFVNGEWIELDPTENGPVGWAPPGAVKLWREQI
jgi:transglutaminase-like putative cysteine protease